MAKDPFLLKASESDEELDALIREELDALGDNINDDEDLDAFDGTVYNEPEPNEQEEMVG